MEYWVLVKEAYEKLFVVAETMFNVIVMVIYRWLIHAMQSRSAYYSVRSIAERVVLILKIKINRVKSAFANFLDHLHFQSFIRAYVNDEPRGCEHEKVRSLKGVFLVFQMLVNLGI